MSERVAESAYGTWASPLSAAAVAAGGSRLDNVATQRGEVYWTENLPTEGGRTALLRRRAGEAAAPITSGGANVRTRVHEYGGAPYLVMGERVVYCQYDDQRLYVLEPNGERWPLTPAGYRYADFCVVDADGSAPTEFVCVREDHAAEGSVVNAIVRLSLAEPGAGELLYDNADFVAYPRVSPDARRLAFIHWDHPNMPWDSTRLSVGRLSPDGLTELRLVAGEGAESVLEPQWDSDGSLYFVSDRDDYWNLYRAAEGRIDALWPRAAEFAAPPWTLGQANYALLGDGRLVARCGAKGGDELVVIDIETGAGRALELPFVHYAQVRRLDAEHVVLLAGSPTEPRSLLQVTVADGSFEVLRRAGDARLPAESVSVAEAIEFASAGGRGAHAFYYAPRNPAFRAPEGSLPPLIALVHGGPTSQALPDYSAPIQYWTSRGFAVVDVNYGGSSGYGRAYRQRLNGAWGVVDVEDVLCAVTSLIDRRLVDPARTSIRGGSAGGYTVLVALATSGVFRAGADYYGVSDMTALARDTHKFESRYLDTLIGPLPGALALYEARSPLSHLDGFKVPLIVFQGAEDPVVPPNQSEQIVDALRRRGAPVAYLLFPGEGHGFRRSENIVRSLEAELSFYGQVFGFEPAGTLPLLPIENLSLPAAR